MTRVNKGLKGTRGSFLGQETPLVLARLSRMHINVDDIDRLSSDGGNASLFQIRKRGGCVRAEREK